MALTEFRRARWDVSPGYQSLKAKCEAHRRPKNLLRAYFFSPPYPARFVGTHTFPIPICFDFSLNLKWLNVKKLTLQFGIGNSKQIQRQQHSCILIKLAFTPHVIVVLREGHRGTRRLSVLHSFQVVWGFDGWVYEGGRIGKYHSLRCVFYVVPI